MMKLHTLVSASRLVRYAFAPALALAVLLGPRSAAADDDVAVDDRRAAAIHDDATADDDVSGWSINFTPVLIIPEDEYGWGGGTDPELRYTLDLGDAHLSAGGRLGGYYAKDLFGITAMPTLRITVPLGPVEPYASFGMGYGWLPELGHSDFARMARLGTVVRFSKSFALGVEGTVQDIEGSDFRFPSFGSMLSIEL